MRDLVDLDSKPWEILPMRVIVGCEYSGRVRNEFIARGHDAVSVDLLPSESPGPHVVGDVLEFLEREREREETRSIFSSDTRRARTLLRAGLGGSLIIS